MREINLKVEDSVYNEIITFLSKFKKEEVEVQDKNVRITEEENAYIRKVYAELDFNDSSQWSSQEELEKYLDS